MTKSGWIALSWADSSSAACLALSGVAAFEESSPPSSVSTDFSLYSLLRLVLTQVYPPLHLAHGLSLVPPWTVNVPR